MTTLLWIGIIGAGAAVAIVIATWWWQDDAATRATPPGWDADDTLATITQELRTVRPPAAGRHAHIAERACDHISTRRSHVARHALDTRVDDALLAVTRELPVVERARVLAWTTGLAAWRPVGDPPAWCRRAQLELHRRLRRIGVVDSARLPRLPLP